MPQTATNPQTGEKLVLKDGQWIPLNEPPPGTLSPDTQRLFETGKQYADQVAPEVSNLVQKGLEAGKGVLNQVPPVQVPNLETPNVGQIQQTGQGWLDKLRGMLPVGQNQAQQAPQASQPIPPAPKPPGISIQGAIQNAFGGTLISNFLNVPHGAGEMLANVAATPQTLVGMGTAAMKGQPMQPIQRFLAARAQQRHSLPASLLLKIPQSTPEGVTATLRTAGMAPSILAAGGSLSEEKARQLEQIKQNEAQRPIASTIGSMAGDIGTMLMLKPGQRAFNAMDPELQASAASLMSKLGKVGRGLTRAGESAFDASVLASLKNADPAATAGYAAGAQVAGSMAIAAKNWAWKNPASSLVTLLIGHSVWQAIGPGRQDILEAKDQSIRELVSAWGLGAVAGITGAGRLGPQSNGVLNAIADATTRIPRTAVHSFIARQNEMSAQGDNRFDIIANQLVQNPDYFGPEAVTKLSNAITSDKPNALIDAVDSLMQDPRFKAKYDSLTGGQ